MIEDENYILEARRDGKWKPFFHTKNRQKAYEAMTNCESKTSSIIEKARMGLPIIPADALRIVLLDEKMEYCCIVSHVSLEHLYLESSYDWSKEGF